MKKKWCRKSSTLLRESSSAIRDNKGKSRLVVCPDCKRRLNTYWRNCTGDLSFYQSCCWWEYLPPHKHIVKNKKKTRKNKPYIRRR